MFIQALAAFFSERIDAIGRQANNHVAIRLFAASITNMQRNPHARRWGVEYQHFVAISSMKCSPAGLDFVLTNLAGCERGSARGSGERCTLL
jgi:hypothetical protein